MSENGDEGEGYSASVTVGQVTVEASGEEVAEVERLIDEKMEEAVQHAKDLGIYSEQSFHVEAGAGWLIAHGDGETPEEALAQWEAMWERMLSDVEELSDKEREQAGLAR